MIRKFKSLLGKKEKPKEMSFDEAREAVFNSTKDILPSMERIRRSAEEQPENKIWWEVKTPEEFKWRSWAFNSSMAGRPEEAMSYATKGLAINPHSAYLHNMMGRSFEDLKRYDEAIEELTKAVELDPEYDEAYIERGMCYFWKWLALGAKRTLNQDFKKAEADFNKAREIDPKYVVPYEQLGTLYLNAGFVDRKYYRRAIDNFEVALKMQTPNEKVIQHQLIAARSAMDNSSGEESEKLLRGRGMKIMFQVTPSLPKKGNDELRARILNESGLKKWFKDIDVKVYDGKGHTAIDVYCPFALFEVAPSDCVKLYKEIYGWFTTGVIDLIAHADFKDGTKYSCKVALFKVLVQLMPEEPLGVYIPPLTDKELQEICGF